VLDEVLPGALRYRDIWVARLGRLAEIKPIDEYGIEYSALTNRLRRPHPARCRVRESKVARIVGHARTADPDAHRRRADVGPAGDRLRTALMADLIGTRREISRCHSVSIGFDVEAANWPFDCADYYRRRARAARRLSDLVSACLGRAGQPVRLPRTQ
jgi:hypothetical protein